MFLSIFYICYMSCLRSLFCRSSHNIMESVECPSPCEDQEFIDLSMTDETEDLCSICLSCLTGSTRFQKYECVHVFHKKCIDNWSGSCPVCRTKRLNGQSTICQNENVKYLKNIPYNVPESFYPVYLELWRKTDCKTQNHCIFFKRTYGVIGACESCGYVQSFNLMHPIM